MADAILIDGTRYEVPGEDDWELGELAEFTRLRDKWGDLGATIALVWIVKHRENPSFTIEQAEHVKVGQIEEDIAPEVPLTKAAAPAKGNAAEISGSLSGPSAIPADSGRPLSAASTG